MITLWAHPRQVPLIRLGRWRKSQDCRSVRIAATSIRKSETTFLGLDFGTSGARAVIISEAKKELCTVKTTYNYKDSRPAGWRESLVFLLQSLQESYPDYMEHLGAICMDGTSSTMIITDSDGTPQDGVFMYDEKGSRSALEYVQAISPSSTNVVCSSTSTLVKLYTWLEERNLLQEPPMNLTLQHQCDFLASLLHGRNSVSDWNNSLKLGYDPEGLQPGDTRWPDWLCDKPFTHMLPQKVYPPGYPIARVDLNFFQSVGVSVPSTCIVCSGTTDSIAAFVAADCGEEGDAVTSLGSTLAIKLISKSRVDDSRYGIYSHRLGDTWLVGGASNTGGKTIRENFEDSEVARLSQQIDPMRVSEYAHRYYPLPKDSEGERFPVNDPTKRQCLEPRPDSDADFLHGILESIAYVEESAYTLLKDLGASPVKKIWTAGGGAQNSQWTEIRSRVVGVPVVQSTNLEAAYGSAILALNGYKKFKSATNREAQTGDFSNSVTATTN